MTNECPYCAHAMHLENISHEQDILYCSRCDHWDTPDCECKGCEEIEPAIEASDSATENELLRAQKWLGQDPLPVTYTGQELARRLWEQGHYRSITDARRALLKRPVDTLFRPGGRNPWQRYA